MGSRRAPQAACLGHCVNHGAASATCTAPLPLLLGCATQCVPSLESTCRAAANWMVAQHARPTSSSQDALSKTAPKATRLYLQRCSGMEAPSPHQKSHIPSALGLGVQRERFPGRKAELLGAAFTGADQEAQHCSRLLVRKAKSTRHAASTTK